MSSNNSHYYEASRLFHLQPIGVGTPCVESLTSYIKRLAEAHSVSPGVLLSKEILPSINKEYLKVNHYSGIQSSKNINTLASDISKAIVRVLEEKTYNNNLEYLTMSAWKECFSKDIFRKSNAWCPVCYEESMERNEPVYEQLIWNFNDIDICRKHKVRLINKCPFCDCEFSNFSNLARVGYCSKCNSWLGLKKYENGQISSKDVDWYNWAYDNVGQLLSIAPAIKEVNLIMFIKNIKNICESYNLSLRSLAKELNVTHDTVSDWLSGKKPRLSNVLVLSYMTEHSVYELLTNEIEFPKEELCYKGTVIKQKDRDKKVNMHELKKVLDNAICSNNGVSLNKLSSQFHVKRSTIEKYFPMEVKELKASHEEYLNYIKISKTMLIKNTMKSLLQRGIFPSRKALTREVGKRIINNDYHKKVWKDTLEELGCTIEEDV